MAAFADEINREDPVRTLPGGRSARAPDPELEAFGSRVRDAGLAVSSVSPGLFKCSVAAPQVEAEIAQGLPQACDRARRWGTDLVSCFGFGRGGATHGSAAFPAAVVDALGGMARVAQAHGCRLVLENEAVCWGDKGTEAATLVRRGGAGLSLCWDPGNAARAGAGRSYPDECDSLRDLAAHGYAGWLVVAIHTNAAPVGAAHLVDAGEPLSPLEANTLRNLRCLRALLG